MKHMDLLSILISLFLCFIINEEVLASPETKDFAPSKINLRIILYNVSASDPRVQPEKYCDSKCAPTVIPPPASSVDFTNDAKSLFRALSGYGTDEHGIIHILTRRGIVQRMKIAEAYTALSKNQKRSLTNRLDQDISGAFELSIMALMTPLPVMFAKEIQNSIAPAGTDHQVIVETLCSISNYGIKSINEFYKILYNVDLDSDVEKNTAGNLQKVLISLAQGKRAESPTVDNAKAFADAQALNGSDAKPWNANPLFTEILGTRSKAHLKRVFTVYKMISGNDINDDIYKEFPGPEGEGLLAIARCIKSKAIYFAEKLEDIISTRKGRAFDIPMIRILVSRSEIDLAEINAEYQKIYNKTLHSSIEKTTGGDYRRVLTNMILGNQPPPPGK